jgi:FtsZ-interacting cell division protein YlmF
MVRRRNMGFFDRLQRILSGDYEDEGDEIVTRSVDMGDHEVIGVFDVENYEDVQVPADMLKQGRTVLINFERVSSEEAYGQVRDFLLGLVYAVDGHYLKVTENVFLFTPKRIGIAKPKTRPGDGLAPDKGQDTR